MLTNTQNDTPAGQSPVLALAHGSAPSSEAIEETRAALLAQKAKVRAGYKMTIDTKAMKTRVWPIIEVWVKAKRQYLPLSVGEVWRYETPEARDAVLSALQNNRNTQTEK